jgi:hypothetical protein
MTTVENYTHWKKTVGHDSCWPDVEGSGFMVINANHKAENPLTALPWQRL